MNRTTALKLAIPVAGLLLVGAVIWTRSGSSDDALPPRQAKAPPPKPPPAERPVYSSPRPPKPAPMASGDAVSRAMDESRLQSTYQNFRTAVATGNRVLEESLRQVLSRDRDAAMAMAQVEVARASDDTDRSIALRTLESLRK